MTTPTRQEEALYDDGKIRIGHYREEEHFLAINSNWLVLQRGVLEELARTPAGGAFRQKIGVIDDRSSYLLQRYGLSYDELHLAIAQARIRELERELQEANSKVLHY